jgi:hypothetical protein
VKVEKDIGPEQIKNITQSLFKRDSRMIFLNGCDDKMANEVRMKDDDG